MKIHGPKERILDSATELFYRNGINNVGIDMVLSHSGAAKMSLYHHFKSKDELVLAFLDKMNRDWSAWLRKEVSASKLRGRQKPLAVFDALGKWFKTPTFKGCPFINTTAEVHDASSRIHRAAWGYKRELHSYLLDLVKEAGYPNAGELADQLLMLVDGAIVRAAMENGPGAALVARRAAAALLR